MPVFQLDYHTESSGTVILDVVPPLPGYRAEINSMVYECAGTAHTLVLLRPVASSTVATRASASALEVVQVGAMRNPSTGAVEDQTLNDYIVYETRDGVHYAERVVSATDTTLTLANALADVVDPGSTVWYFGELARATHSTFECNTSVTNSFDRLTFQSGIDSSMDQYNIRSGIGDPLLFQSENIAAAGALRTMSGKYTQS